MKNSSNNIIIHLSSDEGEKLLVSKVYSFRKCEREFLCVRQVEDDGTVGFGPYFFMEVERADTGTVTCKYVDEVGLVYELWSYIIELLSLEKIFNEG